MVEYGLKELMEAFLFLIVGVMSGIAYLYFLFKKEAQKVVYLFPAIDSSWNRGNTVPLMFDEVLTKTYENNESDAELLSPEIRRVVYSDLKLDA